MSSASDNLDKDQAERSQAQEGSLDDCSSACAASVSSGDHSADGEGDNETDGGGGGGGGGGEGEGEGEGEGGGPIIRGGPFTKTRSVYAAPLHRKPSGRFHQEKRRQPRYNRPRESAPLQIRNYSSPIVVNPPAKPADYKSSYYQSLADRTHGADA